MRPEHWLFTLPLRLRSLFRRSQVDQELDDELRDHFELKIEEYIAQGLDPGEARHAATRDLDGLTQRKEECRDTRHLNLLDHTLQDLHYAIRQLRKSPGFAFTALFVFTLGLSAAIAIFRFVDAALIQPLPYRDQSRLVSVFESSPGYVRAIVSYADFADWKRLNTVFSSLDAYAMNGGFTLTTATGAQQVPGTRASAGFFRTLGVAPALGRDFRAGEDSPSATRTAILSFAAWQKRFAGNPNVLGTSVILNGSPNTIIGVLPREFHFAPFGGAEFWTTLRSTDNCEQDRQCHNLNTVARLRDGLSIETASEQMRMIVRQLRDQYPESNRDFGSANLVPLRDLIVGDVQPILLVSLASAGLLLLVACVNISALLSVRSDQRRREFSVRRALGASSARLFRQFATEGLLLAGLGGATGVLCAAAAIRFLTSLVPVEKMDSMPYLRVLALNPRSIVFAFVISLLAGILFAIIPIARASLWGSGDGIKDGVRGNAGTAWRRFGSHLIVVEVMVAIILMVGAGLLGKSFYRLLHVDIGFRPDRLALLQLAWSPSNYSADQQKIVLERNIVDRISALPGVRSVGISLAPPIDSAWGTASFHVIGRPNHGESNEVINRQVSSGYFRTLEARLARGRYFREDEDASKPLVVIVNHSLANRYFPGEDPLGKQIYYDWDPKSPMQIIGIVEDIHEGPLEGRSSPAVYVPFNQNPAMWFAVLVRTSEPEALVFPRMTAAIHGIDPFISVSGEKAMTARIDDSPSAYLHRSAAWVAGAFAATAFVLSVIGLYGVIAYTVSQRTREIGIRMALGAERTTIYQLILKEAGRLTVFGIVLGLACSLAAATSLRDLLFGVRPWDVPIFSAVAVALGLAALLASYIPARRAASVNPAEVLRAE